MPCFGNPFLEDVTGVDVNQLSAILLDVGIASFVGTSVAGMLLKRNLPLTLTVMPLLLSLLAAALVGWGQILLPTTLLVTLWGFFSSVIPVGWSLCSLVTVLGVRSATLGSQIAYDHSS
ncbi:MAG: hypothetical protein R2911_06930 [Caldilineaceae bacterium]